MHRIQERPMLSLLLFLPVALPIEGAFLAASTWLRGFDNLSDYEVASSRLSVESVQHCLASVSAAAHLVTFLKVGGACREFRCRLRLPNCRKCRNTSGNGAGAANLTEVWTPMPYADQCWITMQHRVSDSMDFNRNWTDYKAGFGEGPAGNFWIGLDALNSLTNSTDQKRRLRVLMKNWNSSEVWVEYASIQVGPESTKYLLNLSNEYSSSEMGYWNAMAYSSGSAFSTKDVNNDKCSNRNWNCANRYKGGSWFNCCSHFYPNGLYYHYPDALNTTDFQGIIWQFNFGYTYSLMEMEMLIV